MLKEEYIEKKFGRYIQSNEIVFDFDDRENGFNAINFTGINLCLAGYNFEVYFAEGQKAPHLHIKNIIGLEELNEIQLKKYKKLFILKYSPKEYLQFLDINLIGNHRIVKENTIHYKYGTIKKLLYSFNPDKKNYAESDLIIEAKKENLIKVSIDPTAQKLKDKLPITLIAQSYGLKGKGNMFVCPFHADKAPSLSLTNSKGLFHCFSCNASGDLIKFVQMLEDLKNA